MRKVAGSLTIVLACSLGLSGCALTSLNTGTPPETYDLTSVKTSRSAKGPARWQLVVNEPTAVRALENDRILVKPGPERISYYGNAVWSDRLPRLVQARIVEALSQSGRFRAVGGQRERLDGDIGLATEIRAFQIEVNRGVATAHIAVYLKMIDDAGRVIGSDGFEARVPAVKDNVVAGVESLNAAFKTVVNKVAGWAGGISRKYTRRDRDIRPGTKPIVSNPVLGSLSNPVLESLRGTASVTKKP